MRKTILPAILVGLMASGCSPPDTVDENTLMMFHNNTGPMCLAGNLLRLGHNSICPMVEIYNQSPPLVSDDGTADYISFSLSEFCINTVSLVSTNFLNHNLFCRLCRYSSKLPNINLLTFSKSVNSAFFTIDIHRYLAFDSTKVLSNC